MNRLIVIMAFLSFSCNAQTVKKESFKTYYSNGKLKAITEMKNGKKDGKEKLFFDNGNLFVIQYFNNGLPVDSFFQYDRIIPNKLLLKGHNSLRSHFVSISVDDNLLFSENDFNDNAVSNGMMKLYYKNGNVANITEFKDGKENGTSVYYYFNGNVKAIEHFKNGEKIPPVIRFDSTGKITDYFPIEK